MLTVLLQIEMVDYEIVVSTNLQITCLLDMQRDSIGVGVEYFLIKRDCSIFRLL